MNRKPASSLWMGWLATLTAASFLVPNHYFPWVSFHEEWLVSLGFAPMMAWAIWHARRLPLLAKTALCAGLIPPLQWCVGLIAYRGDAIMATLYWWGFALAIVAGAQWIEKNATENYDAKIQQSGNMFSTAPLWVGFIFSGIISFGICIHQWLDLQILAVLIADLPPNGRPFANLAQPNHLASLFLLGIAGVIFLFEARKMSSVVSIATSILLVAGLVMTQSRTVLVAAAWLLSAFFLMRHRSKLRTSISAVLSVAAVFALLTWLWPAINHWLLISDSAASATTRTASDARLIFYKTALDSIALKPWAGFGFQQINTAQRMSEGNYHATHNFFQSSHNIFLDIALWGGVPLAIALLLLIIKWIISVIRSAENGMTWATLVGVGFLFVHSMFEYPLYYSYFLLPIGFLIGTLSYREIFSANNSSRSTREKLVIIPGLFCFVIFLQLAYEYPQWEQDWRNARYEIQKFTKTEPAAHPSPAIIDPIEDLLWFVRYPIHERMSNADLNRAAKVANRQSHTIVFFRYAEMAALNEKPDEAKYFLRLLCRFHPASACDQARKDWTEAGKSSWPLLKKIPFPAPDN